MKDTKVIVAAENLLDEPVEEKPTPSPQHEISAHTDSDHSERWVYPPTTTPGYLLDSPAPYISTDQMQRGFSMRSSNIAVSDHGSPLHPIQHAAYTYEHSTNHPYGQAFPIPRSICDASIVGSTINPPPQSFGSSQYPAGVSPHIQPHDRGPPKESPLHLPPCSWGYNPSENSPLTFPTNPYPQVPNSPYIHPDSSQTVMVDTTAPLHSPYESIPPPCEKEPLEPISSLRNWKRASALVDDQGNFIGHARVAYRPPRLRRPKSEGK